MKLKALNSKLKRISKSKAPMVSVDAALGSWSLELLLKFEL
jgi:hypothetical protein